jgi:Mitochondrial genome maintenance MGM101.
MNQVEAEIIEPSNAIALRDKGEALVPVEQKQAMTPAQAKIDAVASLTMKAYDRASQLILSDQEIASLAAEFPDEAFLPGAAGKENLLYIQHACLRDRLNQVFRPGQWSIVPRNRWAEPFKTLKGIEASRVYVEAMLIIRGCFVAEAVGEMEYYPNNASQNYGDAVEGAKTAALRRCCKELGIGLQAWRKDWCDGWWQRKRAPVAPKFTSKPSTQAETIKTPPSPTVAPKQANVATAEQRNKMVHLICSEGPDATQRALGYFIEAGALLPTESLDNLPLNWVPTTQGQMRELGVLIAKLNDTGVVEKPKWAFLADSLAFNAEEESNPFNEPEQPKSAAPLPKQPELVRPTSTSPTSPDDEWFFNAIVPIPHKGQKRADYLKNPDTIGSLFDARHDDEDARRRLFGLRDHFEPKPWTGNDGKQRPPTKADQDFRKALDAFSDYYDKNHDGEEFDR